MQVIRWQVIIFILLVTFGSKAFSCMDPEGEHKNYNERITEGPVEFKGSIEDFLNFKYGTPKWKYDEENLVLEVPEMIGNPGSIPLKASVDDTLLNSSIYKITIYFQDILNMNGTREIHEIFKVGTFSFPNTPLPYISIRANLSETQKVRFFAVFESLNKSEMVRVIQTKMHSTKGCGSITYYGGRHLSH